MNAAEISDFSKKRITCYLVIVLGSQGRRDDEEGDEGERREGSDGETHRDRRR